MAQCLMDAGLARIDEQAVQMARCTTPEQFIGLVVTSLAPTIGPITDKAVARVAAERLGVLAATGDNGRKRAV